MQLALAVPLPGVPLLYACGVVVSCSVSVGSDDKHSARMMMHVGDGDDNVDGVEWNMMIT